MMTRHKADYGYFAVTSGSKSTIKGSATACSNLGTGSGLATFRTEDRLLDWVDYIKTHRKR